MTSSRSISQSPSGKGGAVVFNESIRMESRSDIIASLGFVRLALAGTGATDGTDEQSMRSDELRQMLKVLEMRWSRCEGYEIKSFGRGGP